MCVCVRAAHSPPNTRHNSTHAPPPPRPHPPTHRTHTHTPKAAYGGQDPLQQNTVYLDSHWGLGSSMRELVAGVDCPLNAAYMDAAFVYKGLSTPLRKRNAVCVFEHDPATPALRHHSFSFKWYGAVRGAELVVRVASEVFNYDYLHDLILRVDGSLEARVQTSG